MYSFALKRAVCRIFIFSYTCFLMNRRSISDGSNRTEMAGARLELNGPQRPDSALTTFAPMTLAPTTSAPVAPAAMARAPKAPVMNLIFNIERNETISGAGAVSRIKNPQGTFIILAEPEP
jgi:hypothetical protein